MNLSLVVLLLNKINYVFKQNIKHKSDYKLNWIEKNWSGAVLIGQHMKVAGRRNNIVLLLYIRIPYKIQSGYFPNRI